MGDGRAGPPDIRLPAIRPGFNTRFSEMTLSRAGTFGGFKIFQLESKRKPADRKRQDGLAFFKILVFTFNLVPYLALRIIG